MAKNERVTMADIFKLSLEQYEQKRKKDTSVKEEGCQNKCSDERVQGGEVEERLQEGTTSNEP